MSAGRAARAVGLTPAWGRALLRRWSTYGPCGLADGRRRNGTDSVLTPGRQAELYAARPADPPNGGLWTGPEVARYARHRWGVEVVPQTGWRWPVRLGFSLRVPRPTNSGGGIDRLAARVDDLRAAHPDRAVEVWAADEARLGLKPIARRVRSRKGRRPTRNGQSGFESLYVFRFAHPATGRNRALILLTANTAAVGQALADFAGWADPGGREGLVLVVDNTGWPAAGKLAVPPNVVLFHLPPCTPELPPAEPLRPRVREGVANDSFATPAALTEPLERRCRWLAGDAATVRGRLGPAGPSHAGEYGSRQLGGRCHHRYLRRWSLTTT